MKKNQISETHPIESKSITYESEKIDETMALIEKLKVTADRVNIDNKKGVTTFQLERNGYIFKGDIKTYAGNETRSMTITPNNLPKDIMEKTVMERLNAGETQTSIGLDMGLSQSRISQIKKKHSNK